MKTPAGAQKFCSTPARNEKLFFTQLRFLTIFTGAHPLPLSAIFTALAKDFKFRLLFIIIDVDDQSSLSIFKRRVAFEKKDAPALRIFHCRKNSSP